MTEAALGLAVSALILACILCLVGISLQNSNNQIRAEQELLTGRIEALYRRIVDIDARQSRTIDALGRVIAMADEAPKEKAKAALEAMEASMPDLPPPPTPNVQASQPLRAPRHRSERGF